MLNLNVNEDELAQKNGKSPPHFPSSCPAFWAREEVFTCKQLCDPFFSLSDSAFYFAFNSRFANTVAYCSSLCHTSEYFSGKVDHKRILLAADDSGTGLMEILICGL